jgi:hypothetical protein
MTESARIQSNNTNKHEDKQKQTMKELNQLILSNFKHNLLVIIQFILDYLQTTLASRRQTLKIYSGYKETQKQNEKEMATSPDISEVMCPPENLCSY